MYDDEEKQTEEAVGKLIAKASPLETGMLEQSALLNTLEKSLSVLTDRLNPVLSIRTDADGPEVSYDREQIGSSSLTARVSDSNRQLQKAINIVQSLTRNLEV